MKRRSILILFTIVLFSSLLHIQPALAQGSRVEFTAGVDTLTLSNADFYQVTFNKYNGAILEILDKTSGQVIVNGSAYDCLWSVELPTASHPVIGGCDYYTGQGKNFKYRWDETTSTLTFLYEPSVSSERKMFATVTIQAADGPFLNMQITVKNNWNYPAELVRFPFPLALTESTIQQGLIPLTPGITLNPGFFNQHRTILREHPGLFTDLVAVESQVGNIALHTVAEQDFAPVRLGFAAFPEDTSVLQYENPAWRHDSTTRLGPAEDTTLLVYDFPVLIPNNSEWTSPVVRMTIGSTFTETIRQATEDKRIDDTKPIADKLGELFPDLAKSPLYIIDPNLLGRLPFDQWSMALSLIPRPSTLLLVNYWQGGLYGSHPDVIPPDPALGTEGDLKEAIKAAQQAGMHVIMMSMPAWWNAESPTLTAITGSGITGLAVQDRTNSATLSTMIAGPEETPANGYFVSPRSEIVKQHLAALMSSLFDMLHADIVYEEMLGQLPCVHDYNPAAFGPNDCTGWVDHITVFKDKLLFTTSGGELYIANETGFIGSAHSDRESLNAELGQGNWSFYPLAGLMAHDKVLFYPYWSDGSASKEAMAWSFSMGYMLNTPVVESETAVSRGISAYDSPWTTVLAQFQHQVGGTIAGQQLTDYRYVTADVTESVFNNITVTRNWNSQKSYATDQYTLPPDGFMVQSSDGSLTAGVFTAYNGQALAGSEHYLIELRSADAITLYQPLGDPADLLLAPLSSWGAAGQSIVATAYDSYGYAIGSLPADWTENGVKFTYKSELNGKLASYYILTLGESTVVTQSTSGDATTMSGSEQGSTKPIDESLSQQEPRKISESLALVLVIVDGVMFLTFIITGILLIVQRRRISKA